MPMSQFSVQKLPAICVLSPNNPERKKQFLHLKKNLPQLKAFPAIMGNVLTKKDIQSLLKKKILDRWSIYLSSQGQIGCYLSHLQILKNFVLSKQKYCLIFEDDIHLKKNFKIDLRDALQECPEDWDLLYLYANPNQKKLSTYIKGKKYILKAPRLWHTCAYLVSQKGAKKIINNIQPMRANPIDEYFGDLVDQKKLRAFVTKKVITKNLGDLYRGDNGQLPSIIYKTGWLIFPSFRQKIFLFLYLCYFFLFCIPVKTVFNYWLPSSKYILKRFPFHFLTKIKSKINNFFYFKSKK